MFQYCCTRAAINRHFRADPGRVAFRVFVPYLNRQRTTRGMAERRGMPSYDAGAHCSCCVTADVMADILAYIPFDSAIQHDRGVEHICFKPAYTHRGLSRLRRLLTFYSAAPLDIILRIYAIYPLLTITYATFCLLVGGSSSL